MDTRTRILTPALVLATLLGLGACSGDRSPTAPAAAPHVSAAVVSSASMTGGWSGGIQLSATFSRPVIASVVQDASGTVTGVFAQFVGRWSSTALAGHYDGISSFKGTVSNGVTPLVLTVSADGHTARGFIQGIYPITLTR